MSLNIDDIRLGKKFSLFWEIKDFIIIFTIIFWFGWLFINAQLFVILFDNVFKTSVSANDIVLATPKEQVVVKHITEYVKKDENSDNMNNLKKKILGEALDKKLDNLKKQTRSWILYKPSYESLIKKNINNYDINFNTLPPDNRIIIPKIWVNVHVQSLTNIPIKVIETASYDKYLFHWVIQYPYTPDPGTTWNVFIFGHTSYYWWAHNPYANVFAKIPRLRHWDYMNLTWGWKVYKYREIKKFILKTYQVEATYKKYQDGQYLTIMWCYPIWTSKERMVIIAKRVQ